MLYKYKEFTFVSSRLKSDFRDRNQRNLEKKRRRNAVFRTLTMLTVIVQVEKIHRGERLLNNIQQIN